jgi:TnpA family transposase
MRLKASIETGAVVPSAILRKLAAAGAGIVLSRALRALGRIERTLFTLQWLSDPALRQRSHAGLNKGEASNALRRAVFFHRPCEFRSIVIIDSGDPDHSGYDGAFRLPLTVFNRG